MENNFTEEMVIKRVLWLLNQGKQDFFSDLMTVINERFDINEISLSLPSNIYQICCEDYLKNKYNFSAEMVINHNKIEEKESKEAIYYYKAVVEKYSKILSYIYSLIEQLKKQGKFSLSKEGQRYLIEKIFNQVYQEYANKINTKTAQLKEETKCPLCKMILDGGNTPKYYEDEQMIIVDDLTKKQYDKRILATTKKHTVHPGMKEAQNILLKLKKIARENMEHFDIDYQMGTVPDHFHLQAQGY